jgi:hypothetical protein
LRGRRGIAYPKSINIAGIPGMATEEYEKTFVFIFNSGAKIGIVLLIPSFIKTLHYLIQIFNLRNF